MRIVFIGPPGAGKGTQAERMIEKYSLAHLSTGDMLRAARDAQTDVGKKADEYMSSGQLVPDDIIVGVIQERLGQSRLPGRLPPRRLSEDDRPGRSARQDARRQGNAPGCRPGTESARG